MIIAIQTCKVILHHEYYPGKFVDIMHIVQIMSDETIIVTGVQGSTPLVKCITLDEFKIQFPQETGILAWCAGRFARIDLLSPSKNVNNEKTNSTQPNQSDNRERPRETGGTEQ